MKEVLYEVPCLKSTEDMILALAGQFKQLERLSMTFTGNGKRQDEIFFFAKTRRNLIF